jgi:hypothetical protein
MLDCEDHFYHGSRQSFIDVPGFHGSVVLVDPEGHAMQSNFTDSNMFLWDWPLFGFSVHHGGLVCALVSS